ncbi:MAG: hypothetical protein AAF921_10095 [Cyanobacteria bacterium P01_D01_bin.44]
MDKVNVLLYKYPQEGRYNVEGADLLPERNPTDYGAEISKEFPAIGDIRSHRRGEWVNGQCKLIPTQWTVFDVQTCDRISIVHLSLDGKPTPLEQMNPEERLQVIVRPDGITLSWPEGNYGLSEDEARIETYHPQNSWTIQVCWPVLAPEPAGVAA